MRYPPVDAPGPYGIPFAALLNEIDTSVATFYQQYAVFPNTVYLGERSLDWLREWNVDPITQLSGMAVIPWEKQGCETAFKCAYHRDKEDTDDFLDQLTPNSPRRRRNIW